MRRSLVVLLLVVAVAGCGGDEELPAPIEIAYQYRLNDDRDSVSTEIPEGHYEVRVDGDCSDQTLKFTEGGVFDDEFDVDRLVEIGIDIGGGRWRIRQHDGDEMPDCEGLTLYPEGVTPPPVVETTTTTQAPTTTETPPKTTSTTTPTTTTTAPPTTTTTNPLDNMTQAQRAAFNAFLNPPPPPPPAAVAPSGCDPNYSGCVPIASDVDCAGGSGNGPAYTGYARVVGSDIYDLDSDGDGDACE